MSKNDLILIIDGKKQMALPVLLNIIACTIGAKPELMNNIIIDPYPIELNKLTEIRIGFTINQEKIDERIFLNMAEKAHK
jgi:hypothetical protein